MADDTLGPGDRLKEVLLLRATLSRETDRGAALIVGGYLEEHLKLLLLASFVKCHSVRASLFEGGSAPLGSMSARIDLAYAIGLISAEARRELRLIKRIRNIFAHDFRPRTFEDPEIRDRCQEFRAFTNLPPGTKARRAFTNSAMGIFAYLHAKTKCAPCPSSLSEPSRDRQTQDAFAVLEQNVRSAIEALSEEELEGLGSADESRQLLVRLGLLDRIKMLKGNSGHPHAEAIRPTEFSEQPKPEKPEGS